MSDDLPDPVDGRRGRRRAIVLNFLAKGPFAIVASSLQGAVNYFIVVYLAYGESLADVGVFRTLFSYYALLGLASMFETNKVFIRSIVADDHDATTALFANRLLFSTAAFLVIALLYGVGVATGWNGVSPDLVLIAGLATIIYPLDSYLSLLQARGRFHLLFVTECVKYGLALGAFLLALGQGADVRTAVLAQLGAMALCHVVFFSMAVRTFIDFGQMRRRFVAMIRSAPARQARTYSFANLLPASLEHIDKLLVGWVFGLEFLGVYTLAYSTGRFLYNTLKPALYIYYRRFVDTMPGWKLLRAVAVLFTVIGIHMLGRVPRCHRDDSRNGEIQSWRQRDRDTFSLLRRRHPARDLRPGLRSQQGVTRGPCLPRFRPEHVGLIGFTGVRAFVTAPGRADSAGAPISVAGRALNMAAGSVSRPAQSSSTAILGDSGHGRIGSGHRDDLLAIHPSSRSASNASSSCSRLSNSETVRCVVSRLPSLVDIVPA